MRFIYGKQNWPTMERGQENCYLLTNGLGGFSSASMIGSNTRNDHALLMACTHAPNRRVHMIHRLEEQILWSTGECGEELLPLPGQDSPSLHLSSQDYTAKERREEGYLYLSAFCFEDYPVLGYEISRGTAFKMPLEMEHGNSYGFAVLKGQNTELLEMFDAGLKNMKDSGKYDEILNTYISK